MTEKAYAKINLTLEVVGKKDGYHLLESIVIPIDIYDELTFMLSDKDEVVSNVDIKENNILKTIQYFKETYDIKQSVKVILNKQIPIGAGLGGSSADISATIRGLNRLFNLNKPLKELEDIANALGSDTLFCLYNKRAFIYGRGDQIKFYESDDKLSFLLILPKVRLLTKDVFKMYTDDQRHHYIGFEPFLEKGDLNYIINHTKNDLFVPAKNLSQELKELYDQLKVDGYRVYMSGSGPSLFMINPTKKQINTLKNMYENTLIQFTQEI